MENNEKAPNNQINIELSAEVAEGTYSNLAVISHSSSEFVIDFIRMMPGTPKANVKSRIIITPEHAKRLMLALSDNISKFEKQFGTINLQSQGGNIPQMPLMGFGGGLA